MNVTIYPGLLRGRVTVPPSKSHAHRLLIAAALAAGETRISCPAENADIAATIRCLNALGARVWREGEELIVAGGLLDGTGPATLNCGESGSTLRFFLPLCACLNRKITLTGEGRLPSRPNGPLLAALRDRNAVFSGEGLPLRMAGGLTPGAYSLPGNVSSQYFTGLLLALPLLPGDSLLTHTSPLESKPYVEITLSVLKLFGIQVEEAENGWRIPGGQRYRTPGNLMVEGDWSAAAFWLGANRLGSRVEMAGLDPHSPQGDQAMAEWLTHLGGEIDVTDVPDLMPILSAVAAAVPGETRITGAARLRLKESDRLSAMAQTIAALGGRVREEKEGLVIQGGCLQGGVIPSQNDHRVVMSAAIAATVCQGPVTILEAQAADKSYPGFFEEFARLGGNVHAG